MKLTEKFNDLKNPSGKLSIGQLCQILSVSLLLILIISGVALAITSNYGSDNDTYGMLYTFHNLISGNGYVPSRFTGYPVAEVGIGFIAFYFGSWLNNLVSFLFFIASLILIYRALADKTNKNQLIIFLILAISNPVLFFDNIAPMDYSWSLLFFSLGITFLNKNELLFSAVFFGLSIGTRPNFLIFCIAAVIFLKPENPLTRSNKITLIFTLTFIGALFYVPIWFNSGLGFDWLNAGRPLGQGYLGLIARFVYKSWMAVGLAALPLASYLVFRYWGKIKEIKNLKTIVVLISLNLCIYLYIPADRSYLQLGLILLFVLLTVTMSRILIAVIILNLLSWFFLINPFLFTFKSDNPCESLEAIAVEFKPAITKGELFLFVDGQKESSCYQDRIEGKAKELNSGYKLK